MKGLTTAFLWCIVIFSGARIALSQSANAGDIRGTATDASGALMPGVTVKVLNTDTAVSKTLTTNQDGVYDTSSIVTGHYSVTFSKEGFEQFTRSSIQLQVGVVTIDGSLKVGSASDDIVVSSDLPLLTTESGELASTLQKRDLESLPIVGDQSVANYMSMVPGTISAGNEGLSVASFGNLPFLNVLTDGASVVPAHNGINHPGDSEAIAEVQVQQNGFSAEYGIGGTIINQITKGGTNRFHGAVYDNLQNDAFNAAQYGFGNKPSVPVLRFNQFGFDVGGPILKKRLFFFFNYDHTINDGGSSNSSFTVPTSNVMGGNFAGLHNIYDPLTQTIAHDAAGNPYPVRQSFASEYGSNAVPAALIDSVAQKLQMFYPSQGNIVAGGKLVGGTPGPYGELDNNFFSSIPSKSPVVRYWARVDYDLNSKNRITASMLHQTEKPLTSGFGLSPVFQCPIGCQNIVVDTWNGQLTDVWSISDQTNNEARLGVASFNSLFNDAALGQGLAAKVGWQFGKADDIPTASIGPWTALATAPNAFYKEITLDPSDVVTMIHGRHILHFGGEMTAWVDNASQWGNANAGQFNFSGQYTQQWTVGSNGLASPNANTGVPYADFLLGLSTSYYARVVPEYYARFKLPQFFVQDDYKIRPNLTVNLGLRYHFSHGWTERYGNMDSFDPTVVNPATQTLGAMWYGVTHANGRTTLQANLADIFMPRLGFAWQPARNTTVRGGFGRFTYFWTLDTNARGMGAAFSSSGSLSDQTNGITPLVKLGGNGDIYGTTTPLPYVPAATTPGAYNGQNVTYDQYHQPAQGTYQWNLSAAHQFGQNFSTELTYIGTHGFNLQFPVDLNQVPQNDLSSNDKAFRPYPQFGSITGSTNNASSNYNGLAVTVDQRTHAGLSYNLSYIFSHSLDEQDSGGYGGGASGPQPYQNAYDPSQNYSNSNYDVRHLFKGRAIYELPFGHGRAYLNHTGLVDTVIGGWQASVFVLSSSGFPFTLYATQNTYALAGNAFPNRVPGVSTTPAARSIHNWYNPAAFSEPANGTFGNVRRNSLYGPGDNYTNLSAGKTFSLPWEGIQFQFRFDATNVFNHPNFAVPGGTLSGASVPGQPYTLGQPITGTVSGGRAGELHARITF